MRRVHTLLCKILHKTLCVSMETLSDGGEGRHCRTTGAGYVRALFAQNCHVLCSRCVRSSPSCIMLVQMVLGGRLCGCSSEQR